MTSTPPEESGLLLRGSQLLRLLLPTPREAIGNRER